MLESLPRCQEDGRSTLCRHLPTVSTALTATFLLELLVRISCFPRVKDCLVDGYTWVDIVALLPDCLELALKEKIVMSQILRVMRLVRMSRIFKLFTSSADLITITLFESISTISTIVAIICISILILGECIFLVEGELVDPITKVCTLYPVPEIPVCVAQSSSVNIGISMQLYLVQSSYLCDYNRAAIGLDLDQSAHNASFLSQVCQPSVTSPEDSVTCSRKFLVRILCLEWGHTDPGTTSLALPSSLFISLR